MRFIAKAILGLLWLSGPILAEELRIEQAISMAISNAPDLKIAKSELEAQKHKRTSAWLEIGPRLSATFNASFFGTKQVVNMGGKEVMIRDDVTKTGSLTLTQPLTGIFMLSQVARVESKQTTIKSLNHAQVERDVAFRAAQLFLNAQQAEKMWQVNKVSVEAREAQKRDGELLLEVGRINRGDLLKLELAVSEARLQAAKAEARRDIAIYSLAVLIGHKEPASLSLSSLEHTIVETELSFEEALKAAQQRRVDIKQAEEGSKIASIARLGALVKFIPNINFFAQMDHNFGTPGAFGKKDSTFIGFNLTWEIFNFGSHVFLALESQEQYKKSQYALDGILQKTKIELRETIANVKASREAALFANKAVEQAEESYRMEKIKFAAGKSSATELVLAENARTLAQANAVNIMTELQLGELKLQQAIGTMRPELY